MEAAPLPTGSRPTPGCFSSPGPWKLRLQTTFGVWAKRTEHTPVGNMGEERG